MLKELELENFVSELSSNSPAPGGGSAAALSASLSCALCSMVFNLTIGKKAYREMNDEARKLIDDSIEKTNRLKDEFLNLMDSDAEEFLKLMAAFKLPKSTEEEIAVREKAINEGYVKALDVPMKTAKLSYEIYDSIMIACRYGNKNAISDAGVSALLLQTAIESAILNVKINLSSLSDEDLKQETLKFCDDIVKNGITKKEEILSIVNSKIGV